MTTQPTVSTPVTIIRHGVIFDGLVTVNATSTQLRPAEPGRASVSVTNTGTVTVYLKPGDAATTSAFPLQPGSSITYENTAAINAIVASGTGSCYVIAEGR